MSTRRTTAAVALLASAALTLVACAPDGGPDDDEHGAVTFRLWDEEAAGAYADSFEEFTRANPEIEVEVEVVPWEEYWDSLPVDVDSGEMADIFWTNTANVGRYADQGQLADLTDSPGDQRGDWTDSVAELYERNGALWGVPQVWDSIALFYNTELLDEAGIDPAGLRWDPTGAQDTFLDAARALTIDEDGNTADAPGFDPENIAQFGFNAQHDLQAIGLTFLAENGGQFQDSADQYTFAGPEGEQAFGYLVDLVDTHHVAPPAMETNQDGDHARDLFVQGDLALFQSGPYSLSHLDGAGVEWDLAPKLQGPAGRVSVVHGVAAVASAGASDPEAVLEVLRWLGSAEGQRPLGEAGVGFPAATDAQDAFVDYWAQEGVDVEVFLEAARGQTVPAPRGARATAGADEISPVFQEMFAGRIEVPDALQQAQDAANEAIAE